MMAEQEVRPAASTTSSDSVARAPVTAVPQFALDAADRQIEKIGSSLSGAADSIDEMVDGVTLPGGETVQQLAGDASRRLRDLGERANALDAEELISEAQRVAAARPRLTIAIGVAAGALLALAFMRTAPKETPTSAGR